MFKMAPDIMNQCWSMNNHGAFRVRTALEFLLMRDKRT